MKKNRRAAAVAASLAILTSISACSSSSSSSSSGSSGSGSSQSASGGAAPKGPPVLVGLVEEETGTFASPQLAAWGKGVEAAIDYVNKDLGGFGGRPVQVVTCDSQSSAAGSLICANKMVTSKVDFVTGISPFFGATGIPVLEKAGIPAQLDPVAIQMATSPDSFPYVGGAYTQFPGQAAYAIKQLKSKKATVLEVQQAVSAAQVIKPFYDAAGGELTDVMIAGTSGDLSPAIARTVQSKPDTVFTVLQATQAVQIYPLLAQQGIDPSTIVSAGGALDVTNFFSKISPPSAVENALFSAESDSFDDTANPEVATYLAAMKKYVGMDGRSGFAQAGFATVMTNYGVAKKVGASTFSAASLASYLTSNVVPVFMGYNYSRADAPKAYPALGEVHIEFVRWRGGKVVTVSDGFVDTRTGDTAPKFVHDPTLFK
jgi:branched-chain amino acid transport system substrate-binding protein